MKKINKKAVLILGSAVLAFGVIAGPALAETNQNTRTPGNWQSIMNSGAMQSIHSSTAMQEALTTGDIGKMRDAMNSPEIKAQLGDDLVNQMNQMMSDSNIKAMQGAQGGKMMGSGAKAGNMMGSGAQGAMNWQ